jgi:hypothetical protein
MGIPLSDKIKKMRSPAGPVVLVIEVDKARYHKPPFTHPPA